MIEIKTNRYYCNIWIGEKLNCLAGDRKITYEIAAKGNCQFNVKYLAAEYCGNFAHNNYYGMLGFEFIEDPNASTLTIAVNFMDDKPFDERKGYSAEIISDGIDEFYSSAILNEAVKQFSAKDNVPYGKIIFYCGKTGNVGSSQMRFVFLVKFLIAVFYKNSLHLAEADYINLITDTNEYIKI